MPLGLSGTTDIKSGSFSFHSSCLNSRHLTGGERLTLRVERGSQRHGKGTGRGGKGGKAREGKREGRQGRGKRRGGKGGEKEGGKGGGGKGQREEVVLL